MGKESTCTARIGRKTAQGRLLLETDDLIFRGDPRLVVPLRSIVKATARDGWLTIDHEDGKASFELGAAAEKWAHAINNPRSRIDKLDVKQGSRVAVIDIADPAFITELSQRTGVAPGKPNGKEYDLVFLAVETPAALGKLKSLRTRIGAAGAVWIVMPKKVPALGHDPVVAAAREAGLVDVKTARFSDTHTALKLMIPRDQR